MSRKGTGRSFNKPKGGGGVKPPSRDLESLDAYLEERQLRRKPTAKDGSCLFRAVAEQVSNYHCYVKTYYLDPAFQTLIITALPTV